MIEAPCSFLASHRAGASKSMYKLQPHRPAASWSAVADKCRLARPAASHPAGMAVQAPMCGSHTTAAARHQPGCSGGHTASGGGGGGAFGTRQWRHTGRLVRVRIADPGACDMAGCHMSLGCLHAALQCLACLHGPMVNRTALSAAPCAACPSIPAAAAPAACRTALARRHSARRAPPTRPHSRVPGGGRRPARRSTCGSRRLCRQGGRCRSAAAPPQG